MTIIHGKEFSDICAAAVCICELSGTFEREHNTFTVSSNEDFVNILNDEKLVIEEEGHTSLICLIGIDFSDDVRGFVNKAIQNKYRVIYINTSDFRPDESLNNINFSSFCKNDISTALLAWTYACMNPDERAKCNTVAFDYAMGRTHVAFDMVDREYSVPAVIRCVDDKHNEFVTNVMNMKSDDPDELNWREDPTDKKWEDIIYYGDRLVYGIASTKKDNA